MLLDPRRNLHRSKTARGYEATWILTGTTVGMMFIRRPDSCEVAHRKHAGHEIMKTPSGEPGMISFDGYPDLAKLRAWYPVNRYRHLNELFDAVRADMWKTFVPPPNAHHCVNEAVYGYGPFFA